MNEFVEKQLVKIGFSFIFCNVCGSIRKIKIRTENLREDATCKKCNSNSRKRHLTEEILELINKKNKTSYNSLRKIKKDSGLKIYNVESNGALHHYLKHINNYVCSEYFGPYEMYGKEQHGILNVDLMNIPFDDNTFDLVVSTEVFEHIPNPYKAFSEVYRILKKGGAHVFTVPYYEDKENDEVRAFLDDNNEIVHLMKPEYHGDPIRSDEGILVYTVFAKEMHKKLEAIGFEVEVNKKRSIIDGILGDNNIVFTTTKV
ncbi:class I SAM-dependent methyltransferase [Chryseobacterium rhizosphaerae]|uniref:class I SAM-dependent methyltransferase n=1 Tax=Chryseobacterium rhizosphaerae TaxID=395937 RepID=UPI002359CCBD|nr:class I SAM-dependent methyltransferase [Chryseobacterium rhizosphaerae]MDC8098324.1 class I SAM-dependent methyltransferase [Chryseobacterium rhizosphaerae]